MIRHNFFSSFLFRWFILFSFKNTDNFLHNKRRIYKINLLVCYFLYFCNDKYSAMMSYSEIRYNPRRAFPSSIMFLNILPVDLVSSSLWVEGRSGVEVQYPEQHFVLDR